MLNAEVSDLSPIHHLLASAVLRVGAGRGFVAEGKDRYIVTAAHCLPTLPDAMPAAAPYERTYQALVSRLDEQPTAAAECVFVDPVADVAVLGPPDSQDLWEEYEVYAALIATCPTFRLGMANEKCRGWMLSLEGRWVACEVNHCGGPLWVREAAHPIAAGMSGSPIVDDDGGALGIVSISFGPRHIEGGPNPRLENNLPGWLLKELYGG